VAARRGPRHGALISWRHHSETPHLLIGRYQRRTHPTCSKFAPSCYGKVSQIRVSGAGCCTGMELQVTVLGFGRWGS
jgi:hypothetical protein